MNKNDKIRFGEKLSYFLVLLGGIPEQSMLTTYLLIFYTTVCNMNAAANFTCAQTEKEGA